MSAWEEEAAAAGGEGGAVLAGRGIGLPSRRGACGGNRRVAGSGLPGGGRGLEPSGDPAANLHFLGVTGSAGTATGCLGGRGAERPPFPLVADSFAPCNEQPFFVLSQRRQRLGFGLLASRLHTTLASRHRAHWKRRVNREYTRRKRRLTEGMLVAVVEPWAEESGKERADEEASGRSSVESVTAIIASLRPANRK